MGRSNISCHLARLTSVLALLIVLSGAFASFASAQTAEQLDMFRDLTPEQQRSVLEAMEGRTSGRPRTDRTLEFPATVRAQSAREREEEQRGAREEELQVDPRLGAETTILLHLEVKRFEDQNEPVRPETLQTGAELQPQAGARTVSPARIPPQGVTATPGSAQATGRETPAVRVPIIRTEAEESKLEEIRDRVHRRNPYRLDKSGVLNLPETGMVALAGLTVEQAISRLAAEQAFSEFVVHVTHLPLRPVGREALKPFGYDLFAGVPSTFAPATDIPVPAEYIVGPGDTIEVQLIGNASGRYSLVVGRDGRLDFPELGPIAVGGRTFDEVRSELERRVAQQMIGTQVSIGIGELRSIRVFVLGDAEWPGSYTVSGLSTVTNALFVSGGVKSIGSLRNIQLKRGGRTVATLDLYDLLLRGDTSADARLLPGDVIFIPPVGATVSITGEVRRPAIYELEQEESLEELISLAGGLTPSADRITATIERVNESQQRVTVDVSLSSPAAASGVRSGDVLTIRSIRPVLENSVSLRGHVYRPGEHEFRPGLKLLDVISSIDELKPNADLGYILVRRELPPDRLITVFSADLQAALADPLSSANFELASRDQIHVFDLETGRDRVIEPLLRELRMQSNLDQPSREVSVAGRVRVPGTYPLEPGMRLSDLLRAGGGLNEAAYSAHAELTRYTIADDESRRAELIEIDLRAMLAGDPAADVPLQPFDYAVIKEIPLWDSQEEVEVSGEVRFPGRYPIQRGETLRSLLQRAGGFTDFAFPEGAVFTRRELQERETKQLEALANRMQNDLGQLSLQAAQEQGRDAGEALAIGQSLLENIRSTKALGRLVVDLDRSMLADRGSAHDVILKDGDRLIVPRVTQEVTVIGEVQSTTSHLYRPNVSRDDYIAMSGGFTPRADEDRIFVVRANGSVETRSGKAWFSTAQVEVKPGDTIVVPLDTERMRPLPFWTAVAQIFYQIAVSVAAVNSF